MWTSGSLFFTSPLTLAAPARSSVRFPSSFLAVRFFPGWKCQPCVLMVASEPRTLKQEWETRVSAYETETKKNDFTLQQTTSITQTWNVSKEYECPKLVNLPLYHKQLGSIFPAVRRESKIGNWFILHWTLFKVRMKLVFPRFLCVLQSWVIPKQTWQPSSPRRGRW